MRRARALRALPRAAVAVLTTVACLAVLAPMASAHANLVSSNPAANAALPRSPGQVVLSFSEPADPRLSRIEVVDASGHPVTGVSAVETIAGYPAKLRVTLSQPLPRGVYTVDWRSVSTTDGHVVNGAFAFGIGVAPPPTAANGRGSATSWTLTVASAAGRWSLYWGLALLVGAASTCLIALRGALPPGGRALLRVAVLLAAVGLSAMTLAERASVGVSSLLPLFETHEGLLLLAEGVVLLACGVAVATLDLMPRRSTLAAAGAAAALAMLVHALAGHADAPATLRPFHLGEQWVHMLAVGTWVGGLAWLLLGIRGMNQQERAEAVKRFSAIAGVALGVVVLTGLLRAATEVGSIGNLITTSYGRALLIKVSLVVILALLGALNRFRLVPALARQDKAIGPFRRAAGSEVAVATGVLAVTAVLVGLAPAFVGGPGQSPSGSGVTVSGTDYATTVRASLTVTPGTVGKNDFVVSATDYSTGKPLAGVRSVQLNFSLPARPSVGQTTVSLSQSAGGTWQGTAIEPSIVGDWSVEVVIEEATNAAVVPLTLRASPAPSTSP